MSRQATVQPDKLRAVFPLLKPTSYADGHTRSHSHIRTIAWNPLGTFVAVGCLDRTLRVWNVDKPSVRSSTELRGHTGSVEKVAFNPVRELDLCSVSTDGTAKFWDVKNKTLVNEVKGLGEAFTLVWAPDGETLVVGNKENKLFVLSPNESTPRSEHQQNVDTHQIVFDWSGDKVFATTGEGRIRILSYPSFEPAYTFDYMSGPEAEFMLHGHTSSCTTAELHPLNRYLVTGGTDSLISIWETTQWNCLRTITKMAGPVQSLSISFDGNYVVGGSDEGTGFEVSYIETGEHICTYRTSSACPVVAWSPNRYALAYSDLGTLRIITGTAK